MAGWMEVDTPFNMINCIYCTITGLGIYSTLVPAYVSNISAGSASAPSSAGGVVATVYSGWTDCDVSWSETDDDHYANQGVIV